MKQMNVKAVIFPPDFPLEDQRALFLSLANPESAGSTMMINKCYIFGPQEHDCFAAGDPIFGWQGNGSPAILVSET